ncbi:MAG: hypothetical protein BHW64_01850 [Candidatus Melainabacteria bacterium LEY3_CP_29_8]|nr:MAG: hypothetical protein BHW64_01850 [Candidatus Melainabacteria bacterium LEY3_CP_29_8]
MTEMDKIKIEIENITDPAEMAGYLDAIRVAAALYCKDNYQDGVIIENGKIEDITIYGMIEYLQKKVNEN